MFNQVRLSISFSGLFGKTSPDIDVAFEQDSKHVFFFYPEKMMLNYSLFTIPKKSNMWENKDKLAMPAFVREQNWSADDKAMTEETSNF